MTFHINYFAIGLVIAILSITIVRRVERSWIGLSLDAIRLDQTAAKCFGINIGLWKAFAFCLGNFIVGVAGAFYAQMLGYIAPPNFTLSDSLIMVTIILLGGLGSLWGIVLCSVVVIVLPEKLQVIQEYRFLLYAVIVVTVILFTAQWPDPALASHLFCGVVTVNEDGVLLECRKLSMRFGGLVALHELDLCVRRREFVGIIGPNGSGKTTLFNVVTGLLKPFSGELMYNGRDITGVISAAGLPAGNYSDISAFAALP